MVSHKASLNFSGIRRGIQRDPPFVQNVEIAIPLRASTKKHRGIRAGSDGIRWDPLLHCPLEVLVSHRASTKITAGSDGICLCNAPPPTPILSWVTRLTDSGG